MEAWAFLLSTTTPDRACSSLKWIEYGVYGDLTMTYPLADSIYLGGTIGVSASFKGFTKVTPWRCEFACLDSE